MKPKITLLLILFLSLLFLRPSLVKSESETIPTTGEAQNVRQNIRKNILEQKKNRNVVKETLQTEREARRAEIKEKKETFRETLQTEREERKMKIEEMKNSFKEKRDAFKEKLKIIKDERKKLLTERIDNRISTVNKNQTARMTNALGKLTEHINKLEEKGVDVALAKEAISTALAAVEAQAAKDYTFTITDEKNLGQSVKASYDTLSQDLKNAQESLVKAKEAVVAAYKAAGTLEKITPTPTVATP